MTERSRGAAARTALARTLLLAVPLILLAYAWAEIRGGSGERLATVALINVVIVVGTQVFVGNSGILSLGHVSFSAVGGYTVAILSAPALVKHARIPDAPFGLADVELDPYLAALVALVVTGFVSLVLGLAFLRLSGIAATIVTLAILVVTNSVLNNWTDVTGGAEAFYGVPTETTLELAAATTVVAILIGSVFQASALGLRLRAAREDELAAKAAGVDVFRARLAAWILSGVIAGAGGVLLALFLGAITPRDFYLSLAFTTVVMLVVGGTRSLSGAVAGVVVVTAGDEVFRWLGDGPVVAGLDLPQLAGITNLYLGLLIVGVMLLKPAGIFGDAEVEQSIGRVLPRLGGTTTPVSREQREGAARPTSLRLAADSLERRFDGILAVRDVSLDVRAGEIVGMIGPNGAGKTTVLNLLSGVLQPTAGNVTLEGGPLPAALHEVARAGVTRTFQTIRLFGELTVRENVVVGSLTAARHRPGHEALPPDALLRHFGLDGVSGRRARTLSYGDQRRLEIARAAALAPEIVLLDEPAAGMNEVESTALREAIRSLNVLLGCGLVVVDHDLSFILGLCQRIYVLDGGVVIAAGAPDEITRDPAVVSAYVGSGVVASV